MQRFLSRNYFRLLGLLVGGAGLLACTDLSHGDVDTEIDSWNTLLYEGQSYPIVKIGDQVWMASNLNVGVRVAGALATDDQANPALIEKYCIGDDDSNCETYGGLYQWAEAMDLPAECNANSCADSLTARVAASGKLRGICPQGWHIPSTADWEYAQSQWTDASVFVGLPAGYKGDGYGDAGVQAFFWASEERDAKMENVWNFNSEGPVWVTKPLNKIFGISVRCVQD